MQIGRYAFMRDAVTNIGMNSDHPSAGFGRYYVPNSLLTGKTYDWMDVVTRSWSEKPDYELTSHGGNRKSNTLHLSRIYQ